LAFAGSFHDQPAIRSGLDALAVGAFHFQPAHVAASATTIAAITTNFSFVIWGLP